MGRIRVIVAECGEGSASPSGLLRAVLEHEGVEIAGEVLTLSELIQLAADEQPDAVVFATRAPQEELDRLRSVAPSSKIVFVSPILIAAEAEMAEAVVERVDVLASLGPVLVHLCAPGRLNARRAMTEGFDRPDWIDRVRKDPVTLREILTDGTPEESVDRPSVTSLQGEARAADRASSLADDEVVHLPDLEAELHEPPQRRRGDLPAGARPEGERRRRWFGFWTIVLSALTSLCLWILPATIPAALVRAADPPVVPLHVRDDDAAEPVDQPRPPDRDRESREHDADALEPGGGSRAPAGSGTGDGPGVGPGGGGDHDGVDGGVDDPGADLDDMPGASAEHNPHGAPPGQSGEHPEPREPQLPQ